MAGYPNSESIEQGNQQILAQNTAKAAAFQQAATQPAPVTPTNPEVAQFAQAKANNQVNNSPRVAGQAGTVYNIFKQPAVEQTQKKTQTVATPVQQQPAPVQQTQNTQNTQNTQVQQPITSTEDLAKAMGYTSPEEEDRLRRASVANQRILALGDALRHIGNIANTTRYAPSQQFNSPVEMERQRYLQGKMLRDKANQTYITYQQAKAKQEAQQREWDRNFEYKRGKDDRDFKFNAAKAAADLAEKQRQYDSNLAFNKDKQKATEARWDRLDKESERAHRASEALRRQSNGIAAGSLNLRRQEFDWKKKNGGLGGSQSQNTIYSRRGYLTKAGAKDADMKRIYDNMYEWGKRRVDPRTGKPYIDEGGILEGISPDMFGGKKISDVTKREAVDRMIMEHDDAAVELHGKYGFEWHEQTPNDKKNSYSQYIVQPSGGTSGGADYSKYIRK